MKRSDVLFTLARILSDGVAIFASLMLAYFVRMQWFAGEVFGLSYALFPAPQTLFPLDMFVNIAAGITLFLMLVFALNGRYRLEADPKALDEVVHVFWSFAAGMALVLVYFFFAKFYFFSRLIFGMAWMIGLILVLLGRWNLRTIREAFYQKGWGRERVLVLGTGDIAKTVLETLNAQLKFECVGILSAKKTKDKTLQGTSIIGSFADLSKILELHKVQEVWLASDQTSEKLTAKLLHITHSQHVRFQFFPDEIGLDLASLKVSTFKHLPVIHLMSNRLEGWAFLFKSLIDLILSVISLVLLMPVFLVISFLVWKENPKASVFYRSPRSGKNKKTFNCYKFRTMVPDAESQKAKLMKKNERKGGVLFKMDNDPRVTCIGKVLRKYSLDELPQVFNVLKQEMSFIGPRPHLIEEVEKYPKDNLQLLSVRPGMSGFAQINGRSSLSFEEEIKYEMFYLKNWTLWLDVMIFIKSLKVMVSARDAS